MSINFGPVLTSACLQSVVPALIGAMVDTTILARVSCAAVDALNSFIRDCPELLLSYIDEVLSVISRSLEETARSASIDEWRAVLVCHQLATVELLAWAAYAPKDYVVRNSDPRRIRDALGFTPDQMAPIYARLIGSLKGILKSSHDSFRPILVGTVRCISRLSDGIGKAKFCEDAADVLSACAARLPQLRGKDCELLLRSVGDICEMLGADCGPLLPLLMPPLMGIARSTARVPGSTMDEWNQQVACCKEALLVIKELSIALGGAFQFLLSDYFQFRDFYRESMTAVEAFSYFEFHFSGQGPKFSNELLNTIITLPNHINNYPSLWEAMRQYASPCVTPSHPALLRVTHAAFAPFVAELSTVLLDNMKTSDLDELGLYHLLACIAHQALGFYLRFKICCQMGMTAMRALWLAHWPEMKSAIKLKKQCGWYLVCVLSRCMKKLGQEGVSTTEMREVEETIREVLLTIELTGVRRDSNGDETDEEMLLQNISSLVFDLFKEFGANCFGTVHNLIPAVFASGTCRTLWGVRLIGSFLREAPEMAFIYHEDIGAVLLTSLDDNYPKIRRSASYTIGVVALFQFMKRPEWTPFTAQSLVPLSEMVARPDARSNKCCIAATENAIAAVAKIITHCEGIDASQVLPSFLDWLLLHGIREDKEESPHVYGTLADLIEIQHPLIMGEKNGNYAKLIKTIVQAMNREAFEVTEEAQLVKKRLVIILKDMKLADEPFFHRCLEAARLEEIEKDVLNKILS